MDTYVSVCIYICVWYSHSDYFKVFYKLFELGSKWNLPVIIDIYVYLLSSLWFINFPPSPLSPTLVFPWKFVLEEARFVPQSFCPLRNVADFVCMSSFNLSLCGLCLLWLVFTSGEPGRPQLGLLLFRLFHRCLCTPLLLSCLLLGCINHGVLGDCCLIVWHLVSEI